MPGKKPGHWQVGRQGTAGRPKRFSRLRALVWHDVSLAEHGGAPELRDEGF